MGVTTKCLKNIMLMTLYIKYLNPHHETLLLGEIMSNNLALIPNVKYRMNSLLTIVTSPCKVAI